MYYFDKNNLAYKRINGPNYIYTINRKMYTQVVTKVHLVEEIAGILSGNFQNQGHKSGKFEPVWVLSVRRQAMWVCFP